MCSRSRILYKKAILKKFVKFIKSYPLWSSPLVRLPIENYVFIKAKSTWKFPEIFQNSYFSEHLWAITSAYGEDKVDGFVQASPELSNQAICPLGFNFYNIKLSFKDLLSKSVNNNRSTGTRCEMPAGNWLWNLCDGALITEAISWRPATFVRKCSTATVSRGSLRNIL